jgi:hypothetical protein
MMRLGFSVFVLVCVSIAGCGPSDAATEFHIQSADGFPAREYKATVLVNGEPAGERDFRVAR